MRNRYPGICYRCNKLVEVGKGHFERVRYFNPKFPNSYPNAPRWTPGSPNWRTQHAECAIAARKVAARATGGAT